MLARRCREAVRSQLWSCRSWNHVLPQQSARVGRADGIRTAPAGTPSAAARTDCLCGTLGMPVLRRDYLA